MIEQQIINGKDVWIKIEPCHVERNSPHIIPTEYFTASYFLENPTPAQNGEVIKNDEGETKLFESPVAALSYIEKKLEKIL